MKVKIKKLQDGGGFATFTPIFHTPRTPQYPTTQSSEESQKISSSLIDDKSLEDFYKNGGLVNDVNALLTDLFKLEQSSDTPFINKQNRVAVLNIRKKMNEVRQNKEYWLNTITRAKENGGLAEVAIDTYGRLFTKTRDNKIATVTLSEYSKSRDKIKPLTVQELMYERQYNPSLTGQNGVFTVAENAIGIQKITNNVKELIKALGIETTENTRFYSKQQIADYLKDANIKNPTSNEIEGLKILNDILNTPGDYAKVTRNIASQRNHLDQALEYIWDTLGEPAQQKLTVTAIMNGVDNPKKLIMSMLQSETAFSNTSSITAEKLPEQTESKNSNENKPITTFEIQNNSKLGKEVVRWNDVKTGSTMYLMGNTVGLWQDASTNKMLPMGTLESLLNSHTGALLEQNKVFFGDKKVSMADKQNIIVDPSSGSARVYFPVDSAGNPNYDLMKNIEEIRKTAPDNATPEQLNKIFADRGFNYVQFDNDYQIKENANFRPFLLLYAYADEKSRSVENNNQIRELAGPESDETADVLNRIYDKEKIESPTGFWNWSNTYYKGNLLIPYQNESSIIAASIAGNVVTTRPTLEQVKTHYNVENARKINADSNIFNR